MKVGGFFDGRQRGPQLVGGPEVPEGPVGQLPDETLPVSHGALAVVLVQLAHDHAQAVDETAGWNLKRKKKLKIVFKNK